MKILHVSTDDSGGGAARAAYRIHRALADSGIDSRMRVLRRGTDDSSVIGGRSHSVLGRLTARVQNRWVAYHQRGWHTDNPVLHTFGTEGAQLVEQLNASDADVLHLHWISGILSVADIGRLRKPIVWTIHDMWAFCGGEHYASDGPDARFRQGYRPDNRPPVERGPDLNRRTWEAKRKAWSRQRFSVVSPSQWLAECARQSVLFRETPVHVVAHPLDMTGIWRPLERNAARIALGLPLKKRLILFGADGGVADPRKGADLLREAIARARVAIDGEAELLIYGQARASDADGWPCATHWLGVVRDDRVLAQAYSAADVMVVPSRQDNLPNTALEAQACGTPVVAFDIGGMPDILKHKETGWLAKPFSATDLAQGIDWVFGNAERQATLSTESRKQALSKFAGPMIAEQYLRIYVGLKTLIDETCGTSAAHAKELCPPGQTSNV